MKNELLSLLFIFSIVITQAQQQDYKDLLNKFSLYAKTNFQDIIGEQTDTASVFYPSKLKPDVGDVKIGVFSTTVTLNWKIPLEQSKKVQVAAQDFIKTTYADNKQYKVVSDGTEDENYVTTNIYYLGAPKPLLVFQTIYYKDNEDTVKSNFVITIYGK